MLDEGQWASITSYLGLCVFALLVAFLFVTADHAEVRVCSLQEHAIAPRD